MSAEAKDSRASQSYGLEIAAGLKARSSRPPRSSVPGPASAVPLAPPAPLSEVVLAHGHQTVPVEPIPVLSIMESPPEPTVVAPAFVLLQPHPKPVPAPPLAVVVEPQPEPMVAAPLVVIEESRPEPIAARAEAPLHAPAPMASPGLFLASVAPTGGAEAPSKAPSKRAEKVTPASTTLASLKRDVQDADARGGGAPHLHATTPQSERVAAAPAVSHGRPTAHAGRPSGTSAERDGRDGRDEKSFPPISDFDADDHPFFAAAPAGPPVHEDFDEPLHPRLVQKMSAEAHRRRAHLGRYVGGAMVAALVLCVTAGARVALTDHAGRTASVANSHAASLVISVTPAAAADLGAVPSPVLAAEPVAAAAPPVVPAPAPDTVVARELPAPVAPAVALVASAPATHDPAAAGKAKRSAQSALESGNGSKAVEAGERSVALDPSDAEAWLILGAAYQTRGQAAQAKRCFNACLKQGTHGPKGECSAMLR